MKFEEKEQKMKAASLDFIMEAIKKVSQIEKHEMLLQKTDSPNAGGRVSIVLKKIG